MARKLILGEQDIARILDRLASEVIDRHGDCKDLVLVGIERRGADLARRLKGLIQEKAGHDIGLGTLDINLYRDDWTSMEASPHVGTSHMRTPITGATVLLIDDVLYTGRTWCSLTVVTGNCPYRQTILAAKSRPPTGNT